MFVPVLLLSFAILSAAVMAYGTHASWAQFSHGTEVILAARRLQWPLVAVSLILCLTLLGLVIAGRRRAWWLIGLAPVLALFVHRFATDPANRFLCIDNPTFVSAAEARHVADDDWVIGLEFADGHYAYPYAALFETPVVIHADHDQRLAVLWSAHANRALAVPVGREVRAAHLEVVSTPGNALLVYNGRIGQFINAVSGRTPGGDKPDGFGDPLRTVAKTTWAQWRQRHPETRVLVPVGRNYATAPRQPIRPTYPLPAPYDAASGERHVVVGVRQPLAIPDATVTTRPLNVRADGVPAVVYRDPADGTLRAFERRVGDHEPRFRSNVDRQRPKAVLVDEETNVGFSALGVAVDGPAAFRGKRLAPLAVEGDLHLGVMTWAYREDISTYGGEAVYDAASQPIR